MREAFLDALPPDVPGRIGELSDYRFVDPEAQAAFDELMEHIREQVMGAYFRSMAEGLRSMSPEDLARFRDMLAELNQMIEQRERGEPYDFEGFMQRHGEFFPGNPKTLDELLEQMAARMAAMSRLLASMSPEERAELQALSEQVLQDMDLAFEVDRLGSNLSSAFPDLGWGEPALAGGDEPMPLSATIDAMERLHELEELDRSLQGDYPGASIDDVDEDALRQALGEDAVRDLRRLKEIERALERAGLVSRERGRLEVTPEGCALDGGAGAGPGVRAAPSRSRGRARGARGRRARRTDRRDPAVAVRRRRADRGPAERVQRRRPGRPGRAGAARARRPRAARGRAAHRGRDRAAAGPLVLDAAARARRPREADGARAARADRGSLPARHAVPDRVQRLRAPDAAEGARGRRVGSACTGRTCTTRSTSRVACSRSTRARRAR